MVNPSAKLFNFFRRYKWKAQDFTDLQGGVVDIARGPWDGLGGSAAVLEGFDVSFPGGLSVDVSSGVAVGASGYMLAATGTDTVTLASPVANPCRSLIVARPVITDSAPITRPTSPFDTVYLEELQQTSIIVLNGTPAASPAYPATQAGDVILAGFHLTAGAASVTADMVDYSIRDALGKNGDGLKGVSQYDQRMLPYLITAATLGIKPSQPLGARPLGLMYAGGSKALAFPLTGGVFTQQDAILNFTTGAITGGDGDSSDFTPTIPTAGNFIWAIVTVSTQSLLSVGYGTLGTYAQCKAAMRNQTTAGAGSIPQASAAKVCYVLVGSGTGAAITEMEIVDARGSGNVVPGLVKSITSVTSLNTPYTMDGTEEVIQIDATGSAISVILPARSANQGKAFAFDRIDGSANGVTITRAGADTFAEPNATTDYPVDAYESYSIFAGSSKWKVR